VSLSVSLTFFRSFSAGTSGRTDCTHTHTHTQAPPGEPGRQPRLPPGPARPPPSQKISCPWPGPGRVPRRNGPRIRNPRRRHGRRGARGRRCATRGPRVSDPRTAIPSSGGGRPSVIIPVPAGLSGSQTTRSASLPGSMEPSRSASPARRLSHRAPHPPPRSGSARTGRSGCRPGRRPAFRGAPPLPPGPGRARAPAGRRRAARCATRRRGREASRALPLPGGPRAPRPRGPPPPPPAPRPPTKPKPQPPRGAPRPPTPPSPQPASWPR